MPLIAPFKGLRYDPRRVGSLSRVVTPPYDVISPEQQRRFYRRHPRNFIRVVYGRRLPGDAGRRNAASRAKAALDAWVGGGILARDASPSVYPYEQAYRLKGRLHRRLGVIALVRLDSRIYPHEEIHSGPKKDRLRLMKALGVLLDPIFGLVPDSGGAYRRFVEKACRTRAAAASFKFEGVRHRLWRIHDPAWIRRLSAILRPRELVIADGHHRFAAALAYRDERRKRDAGFRPDAPYNFVMFYLSAVGAEEPGLLPTHRLVRIPGPGRWKEWLKQTQAEQCAEPVRSRPALVRKLRALQSQGRIGVGLYTGNGAGVLLRPPARPAFGLDVEWLHEDLLKRPPGRLLAVDYTQDLEGAFRRVRSSRRRQALFVMQPPRLQDVLGWARAARRMPAKTTYFYPKLLSGLVEYPLGTGRRPVPEA